MLIFLFIREGRLEQDLQKYNLCKWRYQKYILRKLTFKYWLPLPSSRGFLALKGPSSSEQRLPCSEAAFCFGVRSS